MTLSRFRVDALIISRIANALICLPLSRRRLMLCKPMRRHLRVLFRAGIIGAFFLPLLPKTKGADPTNLCDLPLFGEHWEMRATSPGPRELHTAVWSGTEMLVWGGGTAGIFLNNGGRYNPATDTWRSITLSNAPSGRWVHGAAWTGT